MIKFKDTAIVLEISEQTTEEDIVGLGVISGAVYPPNDGPSVYFAGTNRTASFDAISITINGISRIFILDPNAVDSYQ